MANIFQTILSNMSRNDAFVSSEKATDWLRSSVIRNRTLNTQNIISQMSDRQRTAVLPGRMYLFRYDAKTKDKLPYYDLFPLVFPFRKVKDGFYGLNMHYLPYRERAILMDALYPFLSDNNNDESSRLAITYNIITKFSRSRLAAPCVKHYLNKHVRSKLVFVLPEEWNVALFLPLQRFEGASNKVVYTDSLNKVKA